jgi:peptidylprolyl isomerase
MRRITVLLAPLLLAILAVTACGSGSTGSSSSTTSKVTVTGTFGVKPSVKIPAKKAGSALDVSTVIPGKGPVLASKDAFVGNYVAYIWRGTTNKLASTTYASAPALFAGNLLPGLAKAVAGAHVGSRVLAVIPPKDGYGSQGYAQNGVKPTDTLVFVIDIIKAYAGNTAASGKQVSSGGGALPAVTAAAGAAPKIPSGGKVPTTLTAKTLIQGTGAPVASGQTVVVQYTGVIWRTGKVFDSSWSRGYPFGFTIGASPAQVITGWETGLLHKPVGSRVLLVIPPKDGYGSAGSSQAGIKGTDTLVFVVDILGAFSGK